MLRSNGNKNKMASGEAGNTIRKLFAGQATTIV